MELTALDIAEEKKSGLEDTVIETMQTEAERQTKRQRDRETKISERDLSGHIKQCH